MSKPLGSLGKHPRPPEPVQQQSESMGPPAKRTCIGAASTHPLPSTTSLVGSQQNGSLQYEGWRKAAVQRVANRPLPHQSTQTHPFPTLPSPNRAILPAPANVPAHLFRTATKQGAIRALQTQSIALAPNNADTVEKQNRVEFLNSQADAILFTGQWTDIVKLADMALEIDPTHIKSYNYKFLGLAGQNKWAEALQIANAGLAIERNHCRTLCHKALALQALGHSDESLEVIDVALTIEPDNIEALNCKIKVLKYQNRLDELFATLKHKAAVLLKQGQFGDVIETVNRALEIQGYDLQLLDHRATAELALEAQTYLAQGDCDQAIDTANRILLIDPHNAFAIGCKTQALQKKKPEIILIL